MGHKVYISFKTEDIEYKEAVQALDGLDFIDKSLNSPINSEDEDYILRTIREKYLNESTVTIFLIGRYSSEVHGQSEQRFIKRELQASLYNGDGSTRSGILGVVLPEMEDTIYRGKKTCSSCGNKHNIIRINDATTICEFNYNYYIPLNKCSWSEDDRYCVLVNWADFKNDPNLWIDKAYNKRNASIASKVKVHP